MGLLDDAIRDHLDLKRRSGADPAEIERAEREALGPVRREPSPFVLEEEREPVAELPVADAPVVAERQPKRRRLLRRSRGDEPIELEGPAGDAFDDHEPLVRVRPIPREQPPDPGEPTGQGLTAEPDPDSWAERVEADEPPRLRIESPGDPMDRAEPAPAVPPPVGAPGPPADASRPLDAPRPPDADDPLGETTEYDLETALGAESDAEGGADVLEETPEFLQDTPDHDRLWFEQRPPRDFDFDG